ncbi:hypothetical protein ACFVGV_06115 [Pseudarthrobacter scleromae]|uniref:hypothetical protein n=1 Tax=Pseudarthrobacter scleromae TaxID=158897 RepID=UPI00362CB2AC
MAWDSVPWFVGGGAQHSPEVARLMAYASTNGAEGIVTPGDLKVTALAVPGGSVNVAPGAALIRNRATGGNSQTYVARNPVEDTVGIAPTGSGSGRTDLIVAQIEDPFMAGEPWQDPADPTVGPYIFTRVIPNVPANTTRLQDVPGYSGRSAITLARVDIPASTGTITAAMITDLRALAMPRQWREMIPYAALQGEYLTGVNAWADWPTALQPQVRVPDWATDVFMTVNLTGVLRIHNENADGMVRAIFDGAIGDPVTYDINGDSGLGGMRFDVMPALWAPVTGIRGKLVTAKLQGLRYVTAQTDGEVLVDPGSSALFDIHFVERAV